MNDKSYPAMKTSAELEEILEWKNWYKKIPAIQFPAHWKIQVIPPFCGAMIRFRVSTDKIKRGDISVYLDCYDILGFFGEPYWEVYPHKGDTFRCAMNEIDELLKGIAEALAESEEDDDKP